jgi:hypothetical protein
MCNPLSSHKSNGFQIFNSVSRNWPRTQKNSHTIEYLSFQPLQLHLYSKLILLIYNVNLRNFSKPEDSKFVKKTYGN